MILLYRVGLLILDKKFDLPFAFDLPELVQFKGTCKLDMSGTTSCSCNKLSRRAWDLNLLRNHIIDSFSVVFNLCAECVFWWVIRKTGHRVYCYCHNFCLKAVPVKREFCFLHAEIYEIWVVDLDSIATIDICLSRKNCNYTSQTLVTSGSPWSWIVYTTV